MYILKFPNNCACRQRKTTQRR